MQQVHKIETTVIHHFQEISKSMTRVNIIVSSQKGHQIKFEEHDLSLGIYIFLEGGGVGRGYTRNSIFTLSFSD